MKLSIVLSVHNKAHYLDVFLDQLRRSAPEAELVLVDDGSTDGTRAILERHADRLIVTDDVWEVRANNAGLAAATGDYVAIVQDDDFILAADWLAVCAAFMHTHGIAILSGRGTGQIGIRCPQQEALPHRTWHTANGIEIFENAPDPYTIDGDHYVYLHSLVKRFRLPPGPRMETLVTLCPMVIRSPWILSRRVLDTVGGLDETFAPLLYDDLDYCMRAGERGFTVAFTSVPQVCRFGGGSLGLYAEPDKRRFFEDAGRRNLRTLLSRHRHRFIGLREMTVRNIGNLQFDLLSPRFADCAGFADAIPAVAAWRPDTA